MERTQLLTSFQDFGLADPISRALKEENYVTPTPIQAQTIPLALAGRDVVGIAQTGTGKTAAFALPILHRLLEHRIKPQPKACRVLVLSPTRELSGQILEASTPTAGIAIDFGACDRRCPMGVRSARSCRASKSWSPPPAACSISCKATV